MNPMWSWLLIGILPYYARKRKDKHNFLLEVRACFWSISITRKKRPGKKSGQYDVVFHIPLLKRLRK